MNRALGALCMLCLFGCASVPDGIEAVKDFDAERYLGTWYEIARLDHSFERGLSNVSATYAKRSDGGISVLNRGFDDAKDRWKEARGKAYFVEGPTVGRLRVTFFWPFYGGYNVFALDPGYRSSMLCGNDRSFLWILARDRTLPPEVLDPLVAKAKALGFDTDALIFVKQDREE